MPRPKGTLNKDTVERIKKAIADGDTSRIPAKMMKIFRENYSDQSASLLQSQDTSELEEQIEMTLTPESEGIPDMPELTDEVRQRIAQARSNAQHANPADDVIYEESTDPMSQHLIDTRHGPPSSEVPKHPYDMTAHMKAVRDGEPLYSTEPAGKVKPEDIQGDKDHEAVFLASAGMSSDLAEQLITAPPGDYVQEKSLNQVADEIGKYGKELPAGKVTLVDKVDKIELPNSHSPTFTDHSHYGLPGWTEFILSQLIPKTECIIKDGSIIPRNNGLRRMVTEHIGPIVATECDVVGVPTRENCGLWAVRAMVKVRIDNSDHPLFIPYPNPDGTPGKIGTSVQKWSDVSSVFASMSGQSDVVTLNPVASAYTAALSRCFRQILGLVGVYASEELEDKGKPTKYHNPDGEPNVEQNNRPISDKQISMIENLCSTYNCDPIKITRNVLGRKINSLDELSFQEGKAVQAEVNKLQHS